MPPALPWVESFLSVVCSRSADFHGEPLATRVSEPCEQHTLSGECWTHSQEKGREECWQPLSLEEQKRNSDTSSFLGLLFVSLV